jgi:DNA-binding MarR family transcriptional regulator
VTALTGQNSLFAALDAMRASFPSLTLRQSIAFLYVCENEGLSLRELAYISRMHDQTVSRGVRSMALGGPDRTWPPLLRLQKHPSDGRLLLIFLSEAGATLKEAVNRAIAERSPIRLGGDTLH